ncbi:hypothetical protein DEO72_LG11g1931 [Vigna unguiculata]|uniref:Uncharacterized protein n=1 Tax=Vigna unguiculata TaxID=3917 RepID=A0A4D6NRM5_VIGUN|nr:hypothetical protein DEO72_LG11g1931 [Vigna unguiculata]
MRMGDLYERAYKRNSDPKVSFLMNNTIYTTLLVGPRVHPYRNIDICVPGLLVQVEVYSSLGLQCALVEAYVYSFASVPQLSSLPLEFRILPLETHPALSPFLGESNSPKRVWRGVCLVFLRELLPRRVALFLNETLPRPSEASSPKRAGVFTSASVIELSPRRRGIHLSESPSRLSETPWPERRVWARVRAG